MRATMKMPGSTYKSCEVSNWRILESRSSNFIFPLLDCKIVRPIQANKKQIVKSFSPGRQFKPTARTQYSFVWNAFLGGSQIISAQRIRDSRFKKIANHFESGASGRNNVSGALRVREVGIIHNEFCFPLQT